jgi:hypothetical protein
MRAPAPTSRTPRLAWALLVGRLLELRWRVPLGHNKKACRGGQDAPGKDQQDEALNRSLETTGHSNEESVTEVAPTTCSPDRCDRAALSTPRNAAEKQKTPGRLFFKLLARKGQAAR